MSSIIKEPRISHLARFLLLILLGHKHEGQNRKRLVRSITNIPYNHWAKWDNFRVDPKCTQNRKTPIISHGTGLPVQNFWLYVPFGYKFINTTDPANRKKKHHWHRVTNLIGQHYVNLCTMSADLRISTETSTDSITVNGSRIRSKGASQARPNARTTTPRRSTPQKHATPRRPSEPLRRQS